MNGDEKVNDVKLPPQPTPAQPTIVKTVSPEPPIHRGDAEEEAKVLNISPTRMEQSPGGGEAEEDVELARAFLESKKARRKAEDDALLLKNRIKLLMMEEERANKKIEETKKKALEINDKKAKLYENQKKREDDRVKREMELSAQKMQVSKIKATVEQKTIESKEHLSHKLKSQADQVKKLKEVTFPLIV